MRIIHSYVPNKFTTENVFSSTIPKEIAYIQMLSVLLAKREHGEIHFYTNEVIKKQVESMGVPYTSINTTILEGHTDSLFCTPKIMVYKDMTEPYVHIDLDTLIFKKIDFTQYESSVFYSHPDLRIPQHSDAERARKIYQSYPSLDGVESFFERSSVTYLDLFYQLYNDHSQFKKKNIKIFDVPNMSIVGVRDFKNFGLASEESLKHYLKNKERILEFTNGPCYVEQLMIHLNLLEISGEYRKNVEDNKTFILPDASLRFVSDITTNHLEVQYPIRFSHNSHLDYTIPTSIEKDGFTYEMKQQIFGHDGRTSTIDSMEDIIRCFNFDFYGLSHVTFYKESDIIQAIVIGYIVENFGPEIVREIYKYFKGIRGHSYNLPLKSGGEKLYQKLTGFKFDPNPIVL